MKLIEKKEITKAYYLGVDVHHLRLRRQKVVHDEQDLEIRARELEELETTILNSVDKSYFFSEYEVDYLEKTHPGVAVGYLPLFLYDRVRTASQGYGDREGLFFVGGFRHKPNEDGMRWFLEEVYPRVRERDPDICFAVAGADMPNWLRNREQDGVTVLGEIPDAELGRWYRRARLIVAPLRFGAGVKGKVVEGASNGIPVVTTEMGAEGIPSAEDFLVVEDDAARQADEIVRLYHDEERWNRLARRGLEAVNASFSRKVAAAILSRDMGIDLSIRVGEETGSANQPD